MSSTIAPPASLAVPVADIAARRGDLQASVRRPT
jgi:hypothetical protein